jgi:hypothetical protein
MDEAQEDVRLSFCMYCIERNEGYVGQNIDGLCKSFKGLKAIHHVDITVEVGETKCQIRVDMCIEYGKCK